MAVPDYQSLMLPVLRAAEDSKTYTTSEVNHRVASALSLTASDLAEMLPSGRQKLFYNRIGWAKYYLVQAGLLKQPQRAYYSITDQGRKVLGTNLDRITSEYLQQFPAYQEFRKRSSRSKIIITEIGEAGGSTETSSDRASALPGRRGEPANQVVRGALLDGKELQDERVRRRKNVFEKSIPVGTPIPEGWTTKPWPSKSTVRIVKSKGLSEEFEDRVWLLLRDLGVTRLCTHNFALGLQLDPQHRISKQLDVVAIESDKAFVVECHTADPPCSRSMRSRVAELASYKDAIRTALKGLLGTRSLECIFVVATDGVRWSRSDLDYAESDSVQIQVWTEEDVQGLVDLTKIAGEGAKYQIYSHVLFDKRVKALKTKVPALRGEMGGHEYFSMIMHPEDLLRIAFVHRRTRSTRAVDVSDSYQRMIQPSRIRAIERFICDEGGFFPGSVIVNFTRDVRVDLLGTAGDTASYSTGGRPVVLTLPPYYGCARIIDGQHRLYGFADLAARESETIPVVAFRDLEASVQARIFVDINQNQKSVASDILWDLYEDLYAGSKDEIQQRKYCVSAVAKQLNIDPASPLHDRILIPKEGRKADKRTRNLSLTSICASIERESLLNKSRQLLFHLDYDATIGFAYERICRFLAIIREQLAPQWDRGDDHYVCTSASMYVYMGILRDVVSNLEADEKTSLPKFDRQVRTWIQPMVDRLAQLDDAGAAAYRSAGGAAQGTRTVRAELTALIAAAHPGFRSRLLEAAGKESGDDTTPEPSDTKLLRLLQQPEGAKLEFKGSLSLDLKNYLCGDGQLRRQEKLIDESVMKEIVAFLNSEGGHLVIGVIEPSRFDSADPQKLESFPSCPNGMAACGIGLEYSQHGWDGYSTRLIELIETRIGTDPFYNGWIEVRRIQFCGKDLAVIALGKASRAQYLNSSEMFVRIGSHTRKLVGPDIVTYCTQHGLH